MPVFKTSYENAKKLNIPSQVIPTFPSIGGYSEHGSSGIAFADFFQEGKISMVVFTSRRNFDNTVPSPAGVVKFYKFENGKPVEYTTSILTDITGCIAPRKLLVADFNGDGKPDVYASCHGSEFGPVSGWPGEHPRFLFSQPDGSYKNVEAPITCYCHGATAGDINGDGKVDIITSDALIGWKSTPRFGVIGPSTMIALINQGNQIFKVESPATQVPVIDHGVLTMELIDVNGDNNLDLVVRYDYESVAPSRIFLAQPDRTFGTPILLPVNLGHFLALDFVFDKGNLYTYGADANNGIYYSLSVVKYDFRSPVSTVIWSFSGPSNGPNEIIWMMPYNNELVPYDASRQPLTLTHIIE